MTGQNILRKNIGRGNKKMNTQKNYFKMECDDELRYNLMEGLKLLNKQEKSVINFYYNCGLCDRKIGKRLGLSGNRIWQIRKRALCRLIRYFQWEEWNVPNP